MDVYDQLILTERAQSVWMYMYTGELREKKATMDEWAEWWVRDLPSVAASVADVAAAAEPGAGAIFDPDRALLEPPFTARFAGDDAKRTAWVTGAATRTPPKPTKRRAAAPAKAPPPARCNCRKSRCLKLYCECFKAGRDCGAHCRCTDCANSGADRELVAQARAKTTVRTRTCCTCPRSGCTRRYCECFKAGVGCGDDCQCRNCVNPHGSRVERERLQWLRLHKRAFPPPVRACARPRLTGAARARRAAHRRVRPPTDGPSPGLTGVVRRNGALTFVRCICKFTASARMIVWTDLDTRRKARLCSAAAKRGVAHRKRATRAELVRLLRAHDAATRIQSALRAWYTSRHPCVNTEDPILLAPLDPDVSRRFVFRTSSGQRVAYNAPALAESVRQMGARFTDPLTREAYSETDLRRLERQAGTEGLVAAAARDPDADADADAEADADADADAGAAGGPPPPAAEQVHETIVALLWDVVRIAEHANAHENQLPPDTEADSFAEYLIVQFTPVMNVLCDVLAAESPEAYERFAPEMRRWYEDQPAVAGLPQCDRHLLNIVVGCVACTRA